MSGKGDQQARVGQLLAALEEMATGDFGHRATISPAHDEIDAIAYAVNVLVGELGLTTTRLAEAEREAQEASQHKSVFLRNVSHELRTPLTAILSFADLLATTVLNEEQRQAVNRIRANGQALRHLVEDLRDLARVEAGKIELRFAAVSPAEVAGDVVQSLVPQARAKGVSLMLGLAGDLPPSITTDARRMRQILMNVVGNAVKYTDRGEVKVALRPLADGVRIAIDVRDTGSGMSEPDQARLFSPFMRCDDALERDHQGVGLGLNLARQLARELGGDLVLLHSAPGQGSTFRITLADAAPDQRLAIGTGPYVRERTNLRGMTVLFAEDNGDILLSYARMLERAGCQVDRVGTGRDAIDRALQGRFDVILMDMQMPVLDGVEATRRLRQHGLTCPILAVSAHGMEADRRRFLDAGCDEYIEKPIDIDDLVARLASYRSRRV